MRNNSILSQFKQVNEQMKFIRGCRFPGLWNVNYGRRHLSNPCFSSCGIIMYLCIPKHIMWFACLGSKLYGHFNSNKMIKQRPKSNKIKHKYY